jgi:hypothetical protein
MPLFKGDVAGLYMSLELGTLDGMGNLTARGEWSRARAIGSVLNSISAVSFASAIETSVWVRWLQDR